MGSSANAVMLCLSSWGQVLATSIYVTKTSSLKAKEQASYFFNPLFGYFWFVYLI